MSGIRSKSLVVLVLAATAACSTGPGPHLHVPSPDYCDYVGMEMKSLAAVSIREMWCVGWLVRKDAAPEGLVLASENGGRSWRRQGTDNRELDGVVLHSVYFADRLRGWIGGTRVVDGRTIPIVLRTSEGGNHWKEVRLPENPDSTVTEIHDLVFKDDSSGSLRVAALDPRTCARHENVYSTADGGRTWIVTEYHAPPGEPFRDQAEFFLNKDLGFRLRRGEESSQWVLLTTGSAGKDWVPITEFSPAYIPTYY